MHKVVKVGILVKILINRYLLHQIINNNSCIIYKKNQLSNNKINNYNSFNNRKTYNKCN